MGVSFGFLPSPHGTLKRAVEEVTSFSLQGYMGFYVSLEV